MVTDYVDDFLCTSFINAECGNSIIRSEAMGIEDKANEGTGNEAKGIEGAGVESKGTGVEGAGNEAKGSEGAGAQGKVIESAGIARKVLIYHTENSKYCLDRNGFVLRNGELYLLRLRPIVHVGVVNREKAQNAINKAKSVTTTHLSDNISLLLYHLYKDRRNPMGFRPVPFDEVKDHIDLDTSLLFANHEIEWMALTSIVRRYTNE